MSPSPQRERPPGSLLVHRALGVATLILPAVVLLVFLITPEFTGVTLLSGAAVFAGLMVWLIVSHRRLGRMVASSSGLACLRCGYDLSASVAGKACPECGEAVDAQRTRRMWRRWGF